MEDNNKRITPALQPSQVEFDTRQAEISNSQEPPLPSPSRGMSEAKVEQQSTETLSFRCWCERCRLTRGRIVKQTQVSELAGVRGLQLYSHHQAIARTG